MKRFLFIELVVLSLLVLAAGAGAAQVHKNPGHMPPHRGHSVAVPSKISTYLGYKAVSMIDGLSIPGPIAVSTGGDSIYFSFDDEGSIFRLRNNKVTPIPVSGTTINACRLRGALFIGDEHVNIYKLEAGGTLHHLASLGMAGVWVGGLDVDLSNGTIYFIVNNILTNWSGLYELPAGSSTPILLDDWYNAPSAGLAVKGNFLYIADYSKGSIWTYSKQGQWAEIVTGLHGPADIGFDKQGNMFVAEFDGGSIARVKAGSLSITRIASGLNEPYRLELDASDRIYFSDSWTGIIWKLYK